MLSNTLGEDMYNTFLFGSIGWLKFPALPERMKAARGRVKLWEEEVDACLAQGWSSPEPDQRIELFVPECGWTPRSTKAFPPLL